MKNNISKALVTFIHFSDADISTFADVVINSVTGNHYFPSTQQAVADLVPILSSYKEVLPPAIGGSRVQIEIKNVAKRSLIEQLRDICRHINFEANNDRLKLLTSGFEITGQSKKKTERSVVREMIAA